MTCKTIELLILESEDRPLDGDERRTVGDHLRVCPDCRAFQADRLTIRESLEDVRRAALPPSLSLRTRWRCLEELGGGAAESPLAPGRTRIPVLVIAASVLFTLLAVVWLTAALIDVTPGQPLPSNAWAAIVFIAQNVLMLFLSPVIFRTGRPSDNETSSIQ
jgi:hypothetical protein